MEVDSLNETARKLVEQREYLIAALLDRRRELEAELQQVRETLGLLVQNAPRGSVPRRGRGKGLIGPAVLAVCKERYPDSVHADDVLRVLTERDVPIRATDRKAVVVTALRRLADREEGICALGDNWYVYAEPAANAARDD